MTLFLKKADERRILTSFVQDWSFIPYKRETIFKEHACPLRPEKFSSKGILFRSSQKSIRVWLRKIAVNIIS